MTPFAEITLDMGYDYGAVGGPGYSTTIVTTAAGREQRNQNWSAARGTWELGERNIVEEKKEYLLTFFHARRGSLQGFRYRDWNNFQVSNEPLAPGASKTQQLIRTFDDGVGDAYVQQITKPRGSTLTLTRGGAPYAYSSVDEATGIVTLNPDTSVGVTAITQANPAVVTTAAAHGLTTGDIVWLAGLTGNMAGLNDTAYAVTVIDATRFSLNGVDSSSLGAHNGSGNAETYPQGETLFWSGEFDTPARFGTDQLRIEFLGYDESAGQGFYRIGSLPMVELKA